MQRWVRNGKPRMVLVLESDSTLCHAVTQVLRRGGIVWACQDADSATAALGELTHLHALVSSGAPDGTPKAAEFTLSVLREFPGARVVLLSSSRCRASSPHHVLTMPFRADDLFATTFG